jgi:hypothetical protein
MSEPVRREGACSPRSQQRSLIGTIKAAAAGAALSLGACGWDSDPELADAPYVALATPARTVRAAPVVQIASLPSMHGSTQKHVTHVVRSAPVLHGGIAGVCQWSRPAVDPARVARRLPSAVPGTRWVL